MITNKSTQILGYADDIDVVGRTTSSVASVIRSLEKEAKSRGLRVNADKTKCMLSSRIQSHHESLGPIFSIIDYDFEVVKDLIYLGSEVTSDNNIDVEIKRRILLANRCLFSLTRLLRSK